MLDGGLCGCVSGVGSGGRVYECVCVCVKGYDENSDKCICACYCVIYQSYYVYDTVYF